MQTCLLDTHENMNFKTDEEASKVKREKKAR